MFYILLAVVLLLILFHIYVNYHEHARLIRKIPGLPDRFIIGNAYDLMRVPPDELFDFRTHLAKQFNGIYRFYAYPFKTVNLYNPEDIEVVVSQMKHIQKSISYKILKPWLQEGLLVSKGSKWQHRRKILTPAFHFNILRQFHVIFEENSKRLVEVLKKTEGKEIDVIPVVTEFTLHSICETAMGTKLSDETLVGATSYKNAIYTLGEQLIHRFSRLHLHVDFLFNLTHWGRQQAKALNIIHKFTHKIINIRKDYISQYGSTIHEATVDDDDDVYRKKKKAAMLDLLIEAEKGGLIDRKGIQEEVDTFMFEGHDTTAGGLIFFLMVIANHPDFQNKIFAELQDIFGDSPRETTTEDLNKMKYLECCIKESLRLYPPVHFIGRILSETITLSNYKVPAGTHCHIHIYDLHRQEKLFKNALKFDPERFLPENSVGRHPYAYIPFSAGPRNCIGQKFAMMEMKSAISSIIKEFELMPVTKPEEIRFAGDIVLRPVDPVYVKFVKRK